MKQIRIIAVTAALVLALAACSEAFWFPPPCGAEKEHYLERFGAPVSQSYYSGSGDYQAWTWRYPGLTVYFVSPRQGATCRVSFYQH